MGDFPMSGGNEYTGVYPFSYLAAWFWDDTATPSTDPNAKPFGPPPFSMRQGMIRPTPGADLNVTIGQYPGKGVVYLPIKRRVGVDKPPALTIYIQLVPPENNVNMHVPSWVGTSVDVEVVNLFNFQPFLPGAAPPPSLKLQGTLGDNLVCQIVIPPDKVKEWINADGALKGRVNEILLDFRFKMNGVIDDGQPVAGQSRYRLFLYCKKNIVFLPGLFGSQIQFTTNDGQQVGFPDFWDENANKDMDWIQAGIDFGGAPPITANNLPTINQGVNALECDDKGVPLIPCPKPSLLMMKGVVVHPFDSVHGARMQVLPKVPEGFRLYTLTAYPYDWRADLTDAAAALIKDMADFQKALAAQPDCDDQVAVIGHSTGGVVIRRALAPIAADECTPLLDPAIKNFGRPPADTLISFAFFLSVPFSGAPKANGVLMTGRQEPQGGRMIPFVVPESLMAVSLTMPIVYHLDISSAYPHRAVTSPGRPPGMPLDNEADKAQFVQAALDAGTMPIPWVVRSDAATAADKRRQLGEGAAYWHQLVADFHERRGGRNFVHARAGQAAARQWFEQEVVKRGLQSQRAVRAPLGWNSYLAARAKVFHEKSRAAVTGPWKTRACIFWGNCENAPTLRQVNLTKVSSNSYPDVNTFAAQRGLPITELDRWVGNSATKPVEDGTYKGGWELFRRWYTDENTGAFTETTWRLDWLMQYHTGDATVPSDSQLAEAKNVAASLYTVHQGQIAPQHMDTTKCDRVWLKVVESMHRGKVSAPTASDTGPLAGAVPLVATGVPPELHFYDP